MGEMEQPQPEVLTVDNLKEAIEAVLADRLDTLATKADLEALRREVDDKISAVSSGEAEKRAEVQTALQDFVSRTTHELREFVTQHTISLQAALKREESSIEQLKQIMTDELSRFGEMVKSHREVEDARHEAQKQIASQVETNTRALQTAQELTNANARAIRTIEAETGDILLRMAPLTFEVMGNRETGKLSLRQEWAGHSEKIMQQLGKIDESLLRMATRTEALEAAAQATEERHLREDKYLREMPRKLWNSTRQLVADALATWAGRGVAALIGAGALTALIEFLMNLIGG